MLDRDRWLEQFHHEAQALTDEDVNTEEEVWWLGAQSTGSIWEVLADRPTRMLIDRIRSIDVDYVVGEPVDYLTRDQIAEVDHALAHYLGFNWTGTAAL